MDLTNRIYNDENAAREHLEALRWPDGPVCPHCGVVGNATKLQGKSTRPGLWKCRACRKPFSATVGTIFERSHIPLHKWILAVHLMAASKKGMSAHQLHRMLNVTYKSAWFMGHRIREAMSDGTFTDPVGGNGGTVEADETYWGSEFKKPKGQRSWVHKMKIVALIDRNGEARSFHVPNVTAKTLKPILIEQIRRDTHLVTDEASVYITVGKHFISHQTVNHHAGEYARGPITTNTVESYFAIMKRGLYGTYHHVSPKHLKRYCGEFDFRWSNRKATDWERAATALRGIEGKRLTYRRIGGGAALQA